MTKIRNLVRRNPHIGLIELYTKLRVEIGYSRHYASLYRVLRRIGFYRRPVITKKPYVPKPYLTPLCVGEKMQMDVKFVPRACYSALAASDEKFYQYIPSLTKPPGKGSFTLTRNNQVTAARTS